MIPVKEIPDQIRPWLDALYISLGAETEAQKGAAACAALGCIAGEVSLRMGPRLCAELLHSLEIHTQRAITKVDATLKA